jgi:hypothetical protein
MVIYEVNIRRPAILEPENDSPVGSHGHSPEAPEVAFQGMQPERRQIQRVNRFRRVQHSQNLPQLADMFSINALGAVTLKKLPQSLVLDGFDHRALNAYRLIV